MAITEKLKVTLMDKDRTKMTRNHRQNREAYELYLKGRFYTNRRGASIITGIQCFKMAIELDPSFALAHTGYADANLMAAFYGLVPAGQVVKQLAPIVGGGGGGRPDFAEAGGKDPSKIAEMLAASRSIVEKFLTQ